MRQCISKSGIQRIAVLLISLLIAGQALAQSSDWRQQFSIYGFAAGLEGTETLGDTEVDIDASFSDILDNLDFAAMAHYRIENDRWAFMSDVMYVALGVPANGLVSAKLNVDQWIVSADVAYRINNNVDLLAGLRYVSLDTELKIKKPVKLSASGNVDWADPIVGVRVAWPFNDRWSFLGRADIGGFGVNSDLTWQLAALVDYRFSSGSSLVFGYRVLDFDYEEGSGADYFAFDMRMGGPLIGYSFRF